MVGMDILTMLPKDRKDRRDGLCDRRLSPGRLAGDEGPLPGARPAARGLDQISLT